MTKNSFDVIVIGSGSAGFSAVEAARGQGASVCVIEKDRLGGECPNYACVPSKAVLRAAAVYRQAGAVREFGIEVSGRAFDWKRVMAYRQGVVETITGKGDVGDRYIAILKQLKTAHRLGAAAFIDAHTIEVGEERLSAKAFVIATGTTDFIPPILGLDKISYTGWKDALRAPRQPKSMAIIGGGPVGCEIATFYASFGTRVVLLQGAPVILNREDEEISARARTALIALGVEVVVGANVQEAVNGHVGVSGLRVHVGGDERMYAVEQVVVAAGKRARTRGLGLEVAGVRMDDRGSLQTHDTGRTSVAHIFGAGDVDGGMMFTHTAHHEGWIAGYNAALEALGKRAKPLRRDERVVPRATFIEPEVASVGMTQRQVREKFKGALVGRYEVAMLGRAVTDSARTGLIKLVAHPKTRKLLGAHFICSHAGELVHEAALAIYLSATVDKLAGMIHAFPTYAEGMKAAASLARVE